MKECNKQPREYGNEAIGKRIKELRIAKGLTHDKLAEAVGSSRTCITKLENGDRDLKSWAAVALADALGTTCDYLLRGVEAENLVVAEDLGLSQETITKLRQCQKSVVLQKNWMPALLASAISGINFFISSDRGLRFIAKMYDYLHFHPSQGFVLSKENGEPKTASFADFKSISFAQYHSTDPGDPQELRIDSEAIMSAMLLNLNTELKNWRDELHAEKD